MKQPNLSITISSLLPGWRYESNHSSEAENGRVVVVWNPILSVVIYLKMDQLVLCGVFNPVTQQSFTAAFMYARNCPIQRRRLWTILRELAASSPLNQSPWIVLGDLCYHYQNHTPLSRRPSLYKVWEPKFALSILVKLKRRKTKLT